MEDKILVKYYGRLLDNDGEEEMLELLTIKYNNLERVWIQAKDEINMSARDLFDGKGSTDSTTMSNICIIQKHMEESMEIYNYLIKKMNDKISKKKGI